MEHEAYSLTASLSLTTIYSRFSYQPRFKQFLDTIIPHFLTERLQALKAQREEFIRQVDNYWQEKQWGFIQDNGKLMNYSTPYQTFHDTILRYNRGKSPQEPLPLIPFQRLGHTSAPPAHCRASGPQDNIQAVGSRPNFHHHEHLRPRPESE